MISAEKAVEEHLLNATKIIEDQIDSEIQRLERLDDDDLEKLRERRLDALKKQATQKQEWKSLGHGEYSELAEEKEFFEVCKKSENVICHFYRDSTFRCKIVDKHMGLLAPKHIESHFVKLNVDRAPFLCKRLGIKVLPTIALVKNGKTGDYIVGFSDLGNTDEFSTEMLEWRLAKSQVIHYAGDLINPPDSKAPKSKLTITGNQSKKNIRGREDESDDSDY